jgi:hypothetical protein
VLGLLAGDRGQAHSGASEARSHLLLLPLRQAPCQRHLHPLRPQLIFMQGSSPALHTGSSSLVENAIAERPVMIDVTGKRTARKLAIIQP